MCLIKGKKIIKANICQKRYSSMSKVTKTKFCWADDEIQLLLESVNQYKCKSEYKVTNLENVR